MWKPGDTFTINVNQGDREAMVLAVIGQQALIEYAMPAGSTALQIITEGNEQRGRSISYKAVPTKWLRAIVEEGVEWDGMPQGAIARRGTRLPTAEQMLLERARRTASDLVGAVQSDGVLNTLAGVAGNTTHPIGCLCGSCSTQRIADEWDPRMGTK